MYQKRRTQAYRGALPTTNVIKATLDCTQCMAEKAKCRDIQFGITEFGIQVWCNRHNVSVFHNRIYTRRDRKVK